MFVEVGQQAPPGPFVDRGQQSSNPVSSPPTVHRSQSTVFHQGIFTSYWVAINFKFPINSHKDHFRSCCLVKLQSFKILLCNDLQKAIHPDSTEKQINMRSAQYKSHENKNRIKSSPSRLHKLPKRMYCTKISEITGFPASHPLVQASMQFHFSSLLTIVLLFPFSSFLLALVFHELKHSRIPCRSEVRHGQQCC